MFSVDVTSSYLKKLFRNEVIYNPKNSKGTVKYNTYSSQESDKFHINIESYKYEKGNAIFMNNAEGYEWKIDLSKEVSNISDLKVGSQKVPSCLNSVDCSEIEVTGKKFGEQMWGEIDKYLQAGSNWKRTYITYDPNSQQLILLNLIFYDINKQEFLDNTLFQNHPEIELLSRKIESEVLILN